MSEQVSGWKRYMHLRPSGKAHYMQWLGVYGYFQPACKSRSDSDFYAPGLLVPSESNKCKACVRKMEHSCLPALSPATCVCLQSYQVAADPATICARFIPGSENRLVCDRAGCRHGQACHTPPQPGAAQ